MKVPHYRKHVSGQARVTINGRDYPLGKYGSKESKAKYSRLETFTGLTGARTDIRMSPSFAIFVVCVVHVLGASMNLSPMSFLPW